MENTRKLNLQIVLIACEGLMISDILNTVLIWPKNIPMRANDDIPPKSNVGIAPTQQ